MMSGDRIPVGCDLAGRALEWCDATSRTRIREGRRLNMAPNAGDTVLVHYRGTLDDGSEFDSSEGRDPLRFTLGAGEVIQGFEDAVATLEVGDSTTVTLPPEQAYGASYDDAVQTVEASAFAEGQEPFVGGMVSIVAPDGTQLAAEITSVEGDQVVLDFNHPLAGQALTFDLTLVEVIPS
jgi:FKBP-type peptidyl-prolyl cis-trans isomerase 2